MRAYPGEEHESAEHLGNRLQNPKPILGLPLIPARSAESPQKQAADQNVQRRNAPPEQRILQPPGRPGQRCHAECRVSDPGPRALPQDQETADECRSWKQVERHRKPVGHPYVEPVQNMENRTFGTAAAESVGTGNGSHPQHGQRADPLQGTGDGQGRRYGYRGGTLVLPCLRVTVRGRSRRW